MNPVVLISAAGVSIGILLIFIALTGSSGPGVVGRLERYVASEDKSGGAEGGEARSWAETLAANPALLAINKRLEARDFGSRLAADLARADVKLRVSEFLVLWGASTVGVPILIVVLSPIVTSLSNPLFLVGGLLVGAYLPRFWLGRRQAGRLNAFNSQLADTITLIANALRAGSSFLQAVELVVRETQPPISTEFQRVIREVNLGVAFDQALDSMVRRVRSDDLELMVTAISIQHQVGGNLAEILDSIAFTIRERVRIKGEIRTLTAQQRMSGMVVALLPIGLFVFLMVAAPSFTQSLFDDRVKVVGLPAGVILLFMGGFMMALGFIIIRRIVDIEV